MLDQLERIRNWNQRVLDSLPPIPKQIKGVEATVLEFFRGRKRVFTDFKVASEKVAAAFLRSGYILLFQLETEVRRLEYLTLHEVEELYGFLTVTVTNVPEAESLFRPLMTTLQQILEETAGCESVQSKRSIKTWPSPLTSM